MRTNSMYQELYEKSLLMDSSKFMEHSIFRVPHFFESKANKEIASVFVVNMYYTNVHHIMPANYVRYVASVLTSDPLDFIKSRGYITHIKSYKTIRLINYFFDYNRFVYVCEFLSRVYEDYPTLEQACIKIGEGNTYLGIHKLFDFLPMTVLREPFNSPRIDVMLRNLVRKSEVDLGIWKSIKPSELYMPLDNPTFHIFNEIGIIPDEFTRKTQNKITDEMRKIFPDDPAKAHLGISYFVNTVTRKYKFADLDFMPLERRKSSSK